MYFRKRHYYIEQTSPHPLVEGNENTSKQNEFDAHPL
jgi:hypothetical protein